MGVPYQSSAPVQASLDGKIRWDQGRGIFKLDASIKAVTSDDDVDAIQNAINELSDQGGGTLLMRAGTYTLTNDLTVPTGVSLVGESFGTTVLVFAGFFGIVITGSDAYSTGTISVTRGSKTVTGSGTSWLANVTANHKIKIDGLPYDITSVDTNTQITLANKQFGQTQAGLSYLAAVFAERVEIENLVIISVAGVGLSCTYTDLIKVSNTIISAPGVNGVSLSDGSRFDADTLIIDAAGDSGFIASNYDLINLTRTLATNSVSHGFNMTDCTAVVFYSCPANANGGSGYNIEGGNRLAWVICEASENTSYGIHILDNTNQIIVNGGAFNRNVDGIRLGGTVTKTTISGGAIATGNSSNGVTIGAGVTKTTVLGNQLNGNTSAALSDAGTGTINANNQT